VIDGFKPLQPRVPLVHGYCFSLPNVTVFRERTMAVS
jgi:hypothetical protein